jgi:hypothetical protein
VFFCLFDRKLIYDRAVQLESSMKKEMGIPQHFGLFFAMGIALIMEGIMSACYHVCPTYSNFQFGTVAIDSKFIHTEW